MKDAEHLSKKFEKMMKDQKILEEKIKLLYIIQFEENINNLLLDQSSFYFEQLNKKMNFELTELYGEQSLENETLQQILKKVEKIIFDQFYTPNLKIISQAVKDYESRLNSGKATNSQNLTHFKKHCSETDNIAIHNCTEPLFQISSNYIIEYGFSKNQSDSIYYKNISHLVCMKCKKVYLANCVSLYCKKCDCHYYSSVSTINDNIDFETATWEKYHCGAVVNDFMKCFKCKNPFYLKLSNSQLFCKICDFETDPLKIFWRCFKCDKDFQTNAKIYNPLEFKAVKDCIKETLINKIPVFPNANLCCNLNPKNFKYFHKKDCQGSIYSGELSNKKVIVCSLCRMMTDEDKFSFTCPKCFKRFKNQVNLKTNVEEFHDEDLIIEIKNVDHDKPETIDHENSHKNILKKYEETGIARMKNRVKTSSQNGKVQIDPHFLNIAKKGNEIEEIPGKQKVNSGSFVNPNSVSSNLNTNFKSPIKLSYSKSLHNSPEISNKHDKENLNKSGSGFFINSKLDKKLNISKIEEEYQNNSNSNSKISPSKKVISPLKLNVSDIAVSQPSYESPRKGQKKIPIELNIDDYKFIKLIGEGSYAQCYSVQDKNKNNFAMKKILGNDLKQMKAFIEEITLVQINVHPNILTIFSYSQRKLDETTYALYILMELGVSDWDKEIKKRIQTKNYYQEEELMIILFQIVKGLSHLQRNQVAHRDIKPQNILIFEGDKVKIADFGEAKEIKLSKQANSTLRGTELYMSPILFEALRLGKYDIIHNPYKSDVYSLALCVLYAATLSYSMLYEIRKLTESTSSNINKIFTDHLSRYSGSFCSLMLRMIEFKESKRCDLIELETYLKKNFFGER